jgi:hypothetical protein
MMAKCTPCWFGIDLAWDDCINNCLKGDCDCNCRNRIIKVEDGNEEG